MDLWPALLIVFAAVLHAVWNLIVKASPDRLIAIWGVFVAGAVALGPVSAVCCTGDWAAAWPHVLATGVLHLGYLIGLARAYDHSDLSSAYPIARGVAPALAAVGGIVFLGESLNSAQVISVAVIVAALLAIAGSGASPTGTAYALLTGAVIALYSVVDSAGVRLHGDGLGYTGGVFVSIALFQAPVVLRLRGWSETASVVRSAAGRLLIAGVLSLVSYALALAVVRSNPVGPVIALREVSVVFGALFGVWFLGERMGPRRLVGVLGVALGAVLLVAL